MSLNIVQMTDNLRSAFYREEINIDQAEYEGLSFEEWLDSLPMSRFIHLLEAYGGDTT